METTASTGPHLLLKPPYVDRSHVVVVVREVTFHWSAKCIRNGNFTFGLLRFLKITLDWSVSAALWSHTHEKLNKQTFVCSGGRVTRRGDAPPDLSVRNIM